MFLWNLVLALLWVTLVGGPPVPSFVIGFVIGFFALRLFGGRGRADGYFRRVRPLARFVVVLFREVVVSGLRIAVDVITPRVRSAPGVVAYPLDARTDAEIALFATLLSYTPGTLALDVSEDRSTLFIHGMFVSDRDRFCRQLKQGLERPLLEVLR